MLKILKRTVVITLIISIVSLIGGLLIVDTEVRKYLLALGCIALLILSVELLVYEIIDIVVPEFVERRKIKKEGQITAIDKIRSDYYYETNNHLLRETEFIKAVYTDSYWIDIIRENKDLERLYKRKNYLNNSGYLILKNISLFITVIISIISSIICDIMKIGNPINLKIKEIPMIIFLFGMVFLVIMVYLDNGNNKLSNEQKYIRQYEIELIDKTIKGIQEGFYDDYKANSNKEEDITQKIRYFQQELVWTIYKSKINKEEKQELVKKADEFSLCLDDYSEYKREDIEVNGVHGYIFCKKSGKVKDENIKDYAELDKILKTYEKELNVERECEKMTDNLKIE